MLTENEQVRVLEMNLSAGETNVGQSYPSDTFYFIKGGRQDPPTEWRCDGGRSTRWARDVARGLDTLSGERWHFGHPGDHSRS